MTNIVIFLLLCLAIQISVLRIWLNSELFSWIQDKLTFIRETKRGIMHYIAYLLTCWQCLGVWVSWGVIFPMAIFIPQSPFNPINPSLLLVLGLAVSLVSEIIEYYFLAGMDTPVKRVYDLDLDEDETVEKKEETVINNEEETSDEE